MKRIILIVSCFLSVFLYKIDNVSSQELSPSKTEPGKLRQIIIKPGPKVGEDVALQCVSHESGKKDYIKYTNSPVVVLQKHYYKGIEYAKETIMLIKINLPSFIYGEEIISARFQVYGVGEIKNSEDGAIVNLFALLENWDEEEVYWEKRPTKKLVSGIEFPKPNFDLEQFSNLKRINNSNAVGWHQWEITDLVKDWANGKKENYGFEISLESNFALADIFTSDHFQEDRRPKLIIICRSKQ